MNSLNDSFEEKLFILGNRLIKSKILIYTFIGIIIINILLIESIDHESKSLFISNDLYYLNMNLKGNALKNNLDVEKNSDYKISPNTKSDIISLSKLSICNKNCENSLILTNITECLNQCISGIEINSRNEDKKIINYSHVFILIILLCGFMISFVLFLAKNSSNYSKNREYVDNIKSNLLEGYELVNY